MDELNIKLFKDDGKEIAMPSITNEQIQEQKKILSEDITKVISGETVKTLVLPENTEISTLNYIFDFTDLESINSMQKEALKSLVSLEGEVQLYLYKKNTGLISFGLGEMYSLERMVPLVRLYVFNNEIRILKNFKIGKPVEEVTSMQFTNMRLNL